VSVRGILLGALGLAALQMVVSSNARADRVGAIATTLAGAINHFLSPSVAAIPDRRGTTTASSPSSSATPGGTTPSGSPPASPAPTGRRPV
jgi:hypothetical protein